MHEVPSGCINAMLNMHGKPSGCIYGMLKMHELLSGCIYRMHSLHKVPAGCIFLQSFLLCSICVLLSVQGICNQKNPSHYLWTMAKMANGPLCAEPTMFRVMYCRLSRMIWSIFPLVALRLASAESVWYTCKGRSLWLSLVPSHRPYVQTQGTIMKQLARIIPSGNDLSP